MEPMAWKAETMRIRTSPAGNSINGQRGFTYLMVLAALVIVGILAGVVAQSETIRLKRDKEQELLFRGMAIRQAIKSYVNAGRHGKQFPRTLDDLVSDPRYASKKHLRQLYNDPVTEDDWLLIKNKSGGITGVTSSSKQKPLKQKFFPPGLEAFEDAQHYSHWVFQYRL